MAAGTNTDANKLTYWNDGLPSDQFQANGTNAKNLGYWVDGMPYAPLFPSDANRTSDFIPFFWGIG